MRRPRPRASGPASGPVALGCGETLDRVEAEPRPSGRGQAESGGGDDVGEGHRGGDVELVVATVDRVLVEAPAEELHAVAEAAVLELAERHLSHPLGPDGDPGEVLAGVPPARRPGLTPRLLALLPVRPVLPGMVDERVLGERGQLVA